MRLVLVSALLIFAMGSASADTQSPSQIACDSKKIGAQALADCLRNAANKFFYSNPEALPTDAPANTQPID